MPVQFSKAIMPKMMAGIPVDEPVSDSAESVQKYFRQIYVQDLPFQEFPTYLEEAPFQINGKVSISPKQKSSGTNKHDCPKPLTWYLSKGERPIHECARCGELWRWFADQRAYLPYSKPANIAFHNRWKSIHVTGSTTALQILSKVKAPNGACLFYEENEVGMDADVFKMIRSGDTLVVGEVNNRVVGRVAA